MRISVDISDELHRDLKAKAVLEGKTITEVVRPLLDQYAYGTVPVRTVASMTEKELVAALPKTKPPGTDFVRPISKSAQAKGKSRK